MSYCIEYFIIIFYDLKKFELILGLIKVLDVKIEEFFICCVKWVLENIFNYSVKCVF